MGMPSGVTPRSTKSSGFCERLPTATRVKTTSPTLAISSPRLSLRCVPSATTMEMSLSATPTAFNSSSRIGRMSACGVLRVPSSTRIRVCLPCRATSSASEGEPMGLRMAVCTAAFKSPSGGAVLGPATHARFFSGISMVLVPCPYGRVICRFMSGRLPVSRGRRSHLARHGSLRRPYNIIYAHSVPVQQVRVRSAFGKPVGDAHPHHGHRMRLREVLGDGATQSADDGVLFHRDHRARLARATLHQFGVERLDGMDLHQPRGNFAVVDLVASM